MSEDSNCIDNVDKFENLKSLIQEYYCLVKKNQDGLPPYATFKEYIDRPGKIQDLIGRLVNEENKNEENKLNAIMELWATGGDIYVQGKDEPYISDKLIHSVSNTTRLQSCIKYNTDGANGKIVNKENLLLFAKSIGEYVLSFKDKDKDKDKDSIEIKHELVDKTEFKDILNNNIDAAINEILFWYYYEEDKYPIINRRINNTRKIFKLIFPDDNIANDLMFNQSCMGLIGDGFIYDESEKKITKQLMLDQLFYSIDEMKSMVKVDGKYEDKDNEIYKFYKKLWNTIKEAKRTYLYKDLNLFKNIIYHGAPGTSKTYDMKKEIKEHLDLYEAGKSEFIQFHGSYYYEDFIGGLKPKLNTKPEDGLSLEFRNGIFKRLCREAGKYEVAYYVHEDWDGKYLDENTTLSKEITLEVNKKKFPLNTKEPVLSQFPPYFILIDEINRADLSKVFGELLFAIEDDYRGFENRFKLSTSEMENEKTAVYWDTDKKEPEAWFFVPKNLYIRGTMNDIDKSIDSIDFAFRRRFKWVEKEFDEAKIREIINDKKYTINKVELNKYLKECKKLNDKIVKEILIADETYKIGHAIFANIVKYIGDKHEISKDSKELLFNNHIEPIVYNYLKMDYGSESKDINMFKKEFVD